MLLGKKVIDGGHSSSKEVEKAMKNMKDLHDKTEKAEVEKNKKIRRSIKILRRYGSKICRIIIKN